MKISRLAKAKDAAPDMVKVKLQAKHLAFKKSYTPDKKHINQIEVSIARDTSIDKDVLAFLAKRREETTRSR
ncbi:hypothetical protein LPH45_04195 [Xylella taiwanensis]|uniref:hypothetical protein n=1 Tax=Xylella taiwanensis TaxID=1444770 RepID=UPI0012695505|nr:hypothetical protein [Xylella taiwanensis]MCD8457452.1 hypothetical protein [Xylella taiwanensis]MCD8466487.1 hypothetical protein [Xylella taiwanensis]MCD8468190.1 hypothetical protein [Xylella taiwanensis]QKD99211.1 hypothetical protein PLS229_10520 [Xylella taiwanensis]UFM94486.1 hypothetical protein LPH39_04315 [Xylella taiwanensis]